MHSPDDREVYGRSKIVLELRSGIVECVSMSGHFPKDVDVVLYDFDIMDMDGDDIVRRRGRPCLKRVFGRAGGSGRGKTSEDE